MLRNISLAFIAKVIIAGLNLLIVILLSRYLGPIGKGQCSLILTSISLFLIGCNVVGGATLVYLAPRFHEGRIMVVSYSWTLMCCCLTVVIVHYLKLIPSAYEIPVFILSVLESFTGIHNNIILSKEKVKTVSLLALFRTCLLAGVLLLHFYLKGEQEIGAYINSLYWAFGINFGLSFYLAIKSIGHSQSISYVNKGKSFKAIIAACFEYGGMNQLAHVIQFSNLRLSYYLLEWYSPAGSLGIYSNGVSIAESIWLISNSIALVQYAKIVNSTDEQISAKLTKDLSKISLVICGIGVCMMGLLPVMAYTSLFGAGFASIKSVIYVLMPGILIYNVTLLLDHFFSGIGKYKINVYAYAVGLAMTLLLSLMALHHYSAIYAGIISSLSYITSSVVLLYFFTQHTGIKAQSLLPRWSDIKIYAGTIQLKLRSMRGKLKIGLAVSLLVLLYPSTGRSQLATTTLIGNTTYQLQTNGSVRNALHANADGSLSAVWVWSATNVSQNFSDRGTGYNFFQKGQWLPIPSQRIESDRTGWPSITSTASGKETCISHITTLGTLDLISRTTIGNGPWNENTTSLAGPTAGGSLWPRMVSGGIDQKSLHVISLTAPTGNAFNGKRFNHQSPCLTYSRSLDEGATWDILHHTFSDIDSSNGFNGFQIDGYAIDAVGSTVAFVAGAVTTDLVLMKSADNGLNWTKTTILNFPFKNYTGEIMDTTGNGLKSDTLNTSDGTYSILIDTTGMVHVWFGHMRVCNNTANTDGAYGYFPYSHGMMYWNEKMGQRNLPPKVIADLGYNGNSFPSNTNGLLPFGDYKSSLTAHPTSAIDKQGNIYLAFDAVTLGTDDGSVNGYTKSLRNIYLTYSKDNGASWSLPLRTDSDNYNEQVFPSLARNVDSCVRYIYQSDPFAGHGIGPLNQDSAANAGTIALINASWINTKTLLNGVKAGIEESSLQHQFSIYPNPAHGNTTLYLNLQEPVRIEVYSIYGECLYRCNHEMNAGPDPLQLPIGSLNWVKGLYLCKITPAFHRPSTLKFILE